MEELAPDLKKQILDKKLQLWKGTLYDAGLDAKVAAVVDNARLRTAAEKRVREAIQAIELIEGLQEELDATNEVHSKG